MKRGKARSVNLTKNTVSRIIATPQTDPINSETKPVIENRKATFEDLSTSLIFSTEVSVAILKMAVKTVTCDGSIAMATLENGRNGYSVRIRLIAPDSSILLKIALSAFPPKPLLNSDVIRRHREVPESERTLPELGITRPMPIVYLVLYRPGATLEMIGALPVLYRSEVDQTVPNVFPVVYPPSKYPENT